MAEIKSIELNIPPNQALIESLTYMLERAKEGVLRSFVGVGESNNKDITRFYSVDKSFNPYQMIGGLSVAIDTIIRCHKLTQSVILDADEME